MLGCDVILCQTRSSALAGIEDAANRALDFNPLKSWLDDICRKIATKFSLVTRDGAPRTAFVLDTLLRYSCRGCIKKVLENPSANGRADMLYIQNHELAVGLLVEGLRQTFEANGFSFKVGQEVNGVFGRPDVIVKPIKAGVLVETGSLEVVIEVKTGIGFSYGQLIRYLLERPKAIGIIWRILPNQILVVDPRKHRAILWLCAAAALKRGLDILNGEPEECKHNPFNGKNAEIKNAQKVLDSYFEALQKSLPRILQTVYEVACDMHAGAKDGDMVNDPEQA